VKKSRSTIDHSIANFVKANFMRKIVEGKYQLNPHLFGKGEFKDISNIRATYDYKYGAVKAEIIEKEEQIPNKSEMRTKFEENFEHAKAEANVTEEQEEAEKVCV
jgi:hypothetical protein